MKVNYKSLKNEVLEYIKDNRHSEVFEQKIKNDLISQNVLGKENEDIVEYIIDILDYLKENLKDCFEND